MFVQSNDHVGKIDGPSIFNIFHLTIVKCLSEQTQLFSRHSTKSKIVVKRSRYIYGEIWKNKYYSEEFNYWSL